jgi:hypothetical protein
MKLALALLALLGLANAQIPLVEEVIRQVTEEIIHDDAPIAAPVPHAHASIKILRVEEIIRQASEEIIYNDATYKDASITAQGTVVQQADVSVNGMSNGLLAPGPLDKGHEKPSLLGPPRNVTRRSDHFKDPANQDRSRRHRKLVGDAVERDPNEEVRMLVGYLDAAGKTLVDETASIVYGYIDEVNVMSVLLTWSQVAPLLNNTSIE